MKQMPRGIRKTNDTEITKAEMVRRALGTLGFDAKPADLKEHIKKEFGTDMDPQHISNYKSILKAKRRRGPKTGRPKSTSVAAVGGFSLQDIQAVKEVADRIGADKVRQLAGVLSK
jgi:hypothetical protein